MKHSTLAQTEILPIPEALYVGTLQVNNVNSMGCLVEDGTLLTTLHSIYDVNTRQYRSLQNMHVYFVKGNQVFQYKVKDIIHDGTAALNAYSNPITWDYARLALEGDPISELGGGLELAKLQEIVTPFIDNKVDPSHTLAISGPIFQQLPDGGWYSSRHFSKSENDSAKSGFTTFPQIGTHTTVRGMSGQAVFPLLPENRTLYAVHRGRDAQLGKNTGFKVSEYLQTVQALATFRPSVPVNLNAAFPPGFQPEANERGQARKDRAQAARETKDGNDDSDSRLARYIKETYDLVPLRKLASHFPKVGGGVFSPSSFERTDTKTYFLNKTTGWYLCYDNHRKYTTVHNEKGQYVNLKGNTPNGNEEGTGSGFHFYDTPPDPNKPGPACGMPQ